MLVATTSAPELLGQLDGYGFMDPALGMGPDFPTSREGQLQIDHTRLALVVAGQTILEDTGSDPAAPDGWWPAVDRWAQQCLLWITTGPLDLASPTAGEQMNALLDSPDVSRWAMVKIHHTTPHT